MFESYKEEVTFNEQRGAEEMDPQNEFYQEDMEESFKKDITSIGRRLIGYMLVFFFFAGLGQYAAQQAALRKAITAEDFYGIWGVWLFIAAGLSLLIWAFSKKFPMKRIYEHVAPRKMTIQSFAMICASLYGVRFISKLILGGIEKLLFEMGIPATLVANTSEELTSSIIFVLYLGVMAPVVEEFIFRGFIGYRLERYGKVFTILFTALIFSLFHANITQEVFTFMAGIVFAYVAIEYGFQWAVVVHMMNNFIFAVVVDIYLAQMINLGAFSIVQLLDLVGFIILVLVVILKWKDIKEYIDVNRGFHGIAQITFSRVTIILFIIYLLFRTFLPFFTLYLHF
mgnify:FL=1